MLGGVHDCSDGGLAVALAEMAIHGGVGFRVEIGDAVACFSESTSRVVLSVAPDRVDEVTARAGAAGVPVAVVGDAAGTRLAATGAFSVDLAGGDARLPRRDPHDHGRGRGSDRTVRPGSRDRGRGSAILVVMLTADSTGPSIGHACGVFGVYAPGQSVAHLTYLGLFALQHRGQESAGIAVSDGETITVMKDMGLVTQVFDEHRLASLPGHLAIGHNRYSTTGSSSWQNAQPVYRSVGDAGFSLGHNGNLTNTAELAASLGMLPGMTAAETEFDSTTDSALVAELIARAWPDEPRSDGRDLELALEQVLPRLAGRVLVRADGRQPRDRRPRPARLLAARARSARRRRLGARERDGGARHHRRALRARRAAGRDGGHRRVGPAPRGAVRRRPDPRLCLFEFVYFSRPDTRLYGQSVHAAAPAHGRGARPAGAGRRRHGDAGPRVGDPRGAGLRAGVGHPLRRRAGEEPLRRPHLHPAEPEAARRRGAA